MNQEFERLKQLSQEFFKSENLGSFNITKTVIESKNRVVISGTYVSITLHLLDKSNVNCFVFLSCDELEKTGFFVELERNINVSNEVDILMFLQSNLKYLYADINDPIITNSIVKNTALL
ncbi:hypothetical protein C5F61_15100 [Photobacterium damselae subsp. damselae]|uniref:hypothetical protein n=1 Tax=Photobacterium damselae TaxID=38293 RepID=UPI000D060EF4|nr:hypothetical protein [Photobacterium damselae]MCG3815188.1 hypothetical protein [Photobacterium damselae]PSB76675.1 hypothetical protein C5F61_15100 [Photobacterium damselae subsp. damselae]